MLKEIPPAFYEKVWGSPDIGPWFAPRPGKTGEVWFQTAPPLPLLTKFLFTTDLLSVQVHPNDEQARAKSEPNGKTEMWHVLRAEPGAQVAMGFRRELTLEEARRASLDGSVMELLNWIPAQAGDTFFVPAGTVHALGAGLVICEIQQNSDRTYRLFDYGRPRELHLDDGLAVSHLGPWKREPVQQEEGSGWKSIARCAYFDTAVGEIREARVEPGMGDEYRIYVAIAGEGKIGGQRYHAGQCWLAEPRTAEFTIEPQNLTRILRTGPPNSSVRPGA